MLRAEVDKSMHFCAILVTKLNYCNPDNEQGDLMNVYYALHQSAIICTHLHYQAHFTIIKQTICITVCIKINQVQLA